MHIESAGAKGASDLREQLGWPPARPRARAHVSRKGPFHHQPAWRAGWPWPASSSTGGRRHPSAGKPPLMMVAAALAWWLEEASMQAGKLAWKSSCASAPRRCRRPIPA